MTPGEYQEVADLDETRTESARDGSMIDSARAGAESWI